LGPEFGELKNLKKLNEYKLSFVNILGVISTANNAMVLGGRLAFSIVNHTKCKNIGVKYYKCQIIGIHKIVTI